METIAILALLVPFVVGLVHGKHWTPTEVRRRDDDHDFSGIRCPRCRWRPKRDDKWQCDCLEIWNTFQTRGECPGCQKRWKVTNCPQCHAWSDHDAWYEDHDRR